MKIEAKDLKEGMVIKYKYYGIEVPRAVVQIDIKGRPFDVPRVVCLVSDTDIKGRVTDIETLEGLRAMKVGDIIATEEPHTNTAYAQILEVTDNLFAASRWSSSIVNIYVETELAWWQTFDYAEQEGWKIVGQEEGEGTKEMDIAEIEKKLGMKEGTLRIKKEE